MKASREMRRKKKPLILSFCLLCDKMRTFFVFLFVCFFDVMGCGSLQTGKHDEAWMVLKHIHDTNMRARGEPERVFTVSTCFLTAHSTFSTVGWQVSVSPCRSTGSRSPNSWTSWWRCIVSQPTLCSRCCPRSRPSSGGCVSASSVLEGFTAFHWSTESTVTASFILTDLDNIHEMLQLPSEGQHSKAGCCLVHTVFWVGCCFVFCHFCVHLRSNGDC